MEERLRPLSSFFGVSEDDGEPIPPDKGESLDFAFPPAVQPMRARRMESLLPKVIAREFGDPLFPDLGPQGPRVLVVKPLEGRGVSLRYLWKYLTTHASSRTLWASTGSAVSLPSGVWTTPEESSLFSLTSPKALD